MASAGERCHISVWLSESFCILNLVRQDFDFITLLCGEGKDATYKELDSCTGEVLGARAISGQWGWSCLERAAARAGSSTLKDVNPGVIRA